MYNSRYCGASKTSLTKRAAELYYSMYHENLSAYYQASLYSYVSGWLSSQNELFKIQLKKRELCEVKMEQKINDALNQIRPFLQRDGGDIEFVEYTDDHIVKVRLQGHCAGCPGAQMTIKGVVERILKESYPEVAGVEAVQ